MGLATPFHLADPIAEDVLGIDSGEQIAQRTPALFAWEKRLRGRPIADRGTRWRLLKTRALHRLRAAAPVLGYRERPWQRWWATDTSRGLAGLGRWPPRPGRHARVPPAAWAALAIALRAGRLARLKGARRDLREPGGLDYRRLNGLSQVFKRPKTELKTGRRRHRRAGRF
jgi:hypothetical protein